MILGMEEATGDAASPEKEEKKDNETFTHDDSSLFSTLHNGIRAEDVDVLQSTEDKFKYCGRNQRHYRSKKIACCLPYMINLKKRQCILPRHIFAPKSELRENEGVLEKRNALVVVDHPNIAEIRKHLPSWYDAKFFKYKSTAPQTLVTPAGTGEEGKEAKPSAFTKVKEGASPSTTSGPSVSRRPSSTAEYDSPNQERRGEHRPSTTSIEHRPSSASIEHRPSSASIEHRPSSASIERRPSSASIEHRPSSSKEVPVPVREVSPGLYFNRDRPERERYVQSFPRSYGRKDYYEQDLVDHRMGYDMERYPARDEYAQGYRDVSHRENVGFDDRSRQGSSRGMDPESLPSNRRIGVDGPHSMRMDRAHDREFLGPDERINHSSMNYPRNPREQEDIYEEKAYRFRDDRPVKRVRNF
eukprot:Nk52_evm2s174 gene=Nk52_evmTU2s174